MHLGSYTCSSQIPVARHQLYKNHTCMYYKNVCSMSCTYIPNFQLLYELPYQKLCSFMCFAIKRLIIFYELHHHKNLSSIRCLLSSLRSSIPIQKLRLKLKPLTVYMRNQCTMVSHWTSKCIDINQELGLVCGVGDVRFLVPRELEILQTTKENASMQL